MVVNLDDERLTHEASLDSLHRLRLICAEVVVTGGPDSGAAASIGASGMIVGSGAGADLRLSDKLISRRHLELRAEASGVRAIDLGSRNGTHVGGARLGDVLLEQDATLTLGSTVLSLRLRAEPLDVPFSARTRFGDALAHSRSMRHVFSLLEQAARTDVTVLLEGDSGTGKEVLAASIHAESARREGPFIVVDCGAIPEQLFESEVFGHERGAFTGAAAARAGAFELASGGTIFLDEVGELPLETQPKLLRALENRSFRRVGGSRQIDVDVRVIAATNRKLKPAVRRGEFREDLFYRLAVAQVTVPRLSERVDDVPLLAELFLRRATGNPAAEVPPDLLRLLCAYHWPGNVRELRNVVERFKTFDRADAQLLFGPSTPGDERDAGTLQLAQLEHLPYHEAKRRLVDEFHRVVLPRVLERAGGLVPRAAELLGIPRASLYRMLQQQRADESNDASE